LSNACLNQLFVADAVETIAGPIPRILSALTFNDRLGSAKARWGIGRMNFTVSPGLYALGEPDHQSPVFVTANYKMTFDRLRRDLHDLDVWILVLDTKGINVWCAAGKGTFGNNEIAEKIQTSGLSRIVSHRNLILPQLSAPGVCAHWVKKNTGFTVVFGPIRSDDLPAFIGAGYKATPEMRLKTFPVRERAALIPMELVIAAKWMLLILPAIFIISGLMGSGPFATAAIRHGFFPALMLCSGLIAGAVITPLLLPWLPGRAFSVKGFASAIIMFILVLMLQTGLSYSLPGYRQTIASFLLSSALAAFLAMNFTGASTYTSLSGVRKEMKLAVPAQIIVALAGAGLWMAAIYGA